MFLIGKNYTILSNFVKVMQESFEFLLLRVTRHSTTQFILKCGLLSILIGF